MVNGLTNFRNRSWLLNNHKKRLFNAINTISVLFAFYLLNIHKFRRHLTQNYLYIQVEIFSHVKLRLYQQVFSSYDTIRNTLGKQYYNSCLVCKTLPFFSLRCTFSLLCTITNTKISTKQIFIKRANLISLRVLNISQLEHTLNIKDEKHQAGVIDTFDTHEISVHCKLLPLFNIGIKFIHSSASCGLTCILLHLHVLHVQGRFTFEQFDTERVHKSVVTC